MSRIQLAKGLANFVLWAEWPEALDFANRNGWRCDSYWHNNPFILTNEKGFLINAMVMHHLLTHKYGNMPCTVIYRIQWRKPWVLLLVLI